MSENHFALDDTDRKILRILAVNGRINNLALAEAVNLSPTPCARSPSFRRGGYYRRLSRCSQPQCTWFWFERVHRRHLGQSHTGTLCRL